MRRLGLCAIALTIAAIVVGVVIYSTRLVRYGFSARDKPGLLEASPARKAPRWAIPARVKDLKSPMPATAAMLVQARNHWADHCATCHANDGSGETQIGRNLYPKAPDMRQPEVSSWL